MQTILITGAGRIGTLIATLLATSRAYQIYLLDIKFTSPEIKKLCQQFSNIKLIEGDITDQVFLTTLINKYKIRSLMSCLSYYHNNALAHFAYQHKLNYFDLTEDIGVSSTIAKLAENAKTIFMPHCGVAPGLVNIAAHSLMQEFKAIQSVKLRVGALPQYIDNALHYALTWSTDGLINEYGNPCLAIVDGQLTTVAPLEGLETLIIDGIQYEAFNTSGGLGTLTKTYAGKIQQLNYKTIRYPGHCEKMRFLMQDLKLNEDRAMLKTILEKAIPRTAQDEVIIYVAVTGMRDHELIEKTFFKKIFPATIANHTWTAIQIATAASACAIIDLALNQAKLHGFIYQEQFTLTEVLNNQFGRFLN